MAQRTMHGHGVPFSASRPAPAIWNRVSNPDFPLHSVDHIRASAIWNDFTNPDFSLHGADHIPHRAVPFVPAATTPEFERVYHPSTNSGPHSFASQTIHNQYHLHSSNLHNQYHLHSSNLFPVPHDHRVTQNSSPNVTFVDDVLMMDALSSTDAAYTGQFNFEHIWSAQLILHDLEEVEGYEDLLRLEEQMGSDSTGLSEETISMHLKVRTKIYLANVTDSNFKSPCNKEEADICVVCQGEYEGDEKIGALQCGHEYHEECIKKWLLQKNVCPICKGEALTRS